MNPFYKYTKFSLLNQETKSSFIELKDEFNKDLLLYDPPKLINERLRDLRKAGEIHREVKKFILNNLRGNMRLFDLCNIIENKINELSNVNTININKGIAFPVGLSINNVVAHDSSFHGDERILKREDLIKIDYGVHMNGHIIDSAFTYSLSDKYNNLIDCTKEATLNAIKYIGIDMFMSEVSYIIEETIKSYEIEINGKIYNINAVCNLGGHNILPFQIHGDKFLLSHNDYKLVKDCKIEEKDLLAIETFATTGNGNIKQSSNYMTHYMLNRMNSERAKFTFNATNDCYNWIINNRKSLPFSIKWIHEGLFNKIGNKYKIGIKELLNKNILIGYPALCDEEGNYSSQDEKTIYIHEYGKEILS